MFGLNRSIPKFCDLKGKVAIITGAKQGMGKADAFKLSTAGAKVVLADVSKEECQLVADEIKKKRGQALAVRCDVTRKTEVDNLIAKTIEKFGRIDILVNNAGILTFKSFLELSEQDFQKVIDVNLKGYFLVAQAVAKQMAKQEPSEKTKQRGSIINIASIAMGQVGMGFQGLTHYCASKGGIVAMAEAMALELAPLGIRVNCIAPGAIDTPMLASTKSDERAMEATLAKIPLKRMGQSEEIANTVLFLASDESTYITGSVMVVDGGFLAN